MKTKEQRFIENKLEEAIRMRNNHKDTVEDYDIEIELLKEILNKLENPKDLTKREKKIMGIILEGCEEE